MIDVQICQAIAGEAATAAVRSAQAHWERGSATYGKVPAPLNAGSVHACGMQPGDRRTDHASNARNPPDQTSHTSCYVTACLPEVPWAQGLVLSAVPRGAASRVAKL